MKIAIAGTGYVGLSNAMLLAQHKPIHFRAMLDKHEAPQRIGHREKDREFNMALLHYGYVKTNEAIDMVGNRLYCTGWLVKGVPP